MGEECGLKLARRGAAPRRERHAECAREFAARGFAGSRQWRLGLGADRRLAGAEKAEPRGVAEAEARAEGVLG